MLPNCLFGYKIFIMKTYHGSCDCGAVKFEVTTKITKISKCNCQICTKKGIIHHLVEQNQFNLISGKDDLSLYQFGTMTAKHFFVNIAEFIRFTTQELILKR